KIPVRAQVFGRPAGAKSMYGKRRFTPWRPIQVPPVTTRSLFEEWSFDPPRCQLAFLVVAISQQLNRSVAKLRCGFLCRSAKTDFCARGLGRGTERGAG